MGQNQEDVEPGNRRVRTVKKSMETSCVKVIVQEGAPSLRRRFAAAHHVFALALLSLMSIPSLSSSPWMRGCTPAGIR